MDCGVGLSVPDESTTNVHRIPTGSPMLAIKRAPADHDTKTSCLGPTFVLDLHSSFFMGSLMWLNKILSPAFAGPSGIRVGWGIDQWQI